MGFDISWLVEGKVIQASTYGKFTVEDLQESSKTVVEMYETSDSPLVHLIIDETGTESMPISIKLFSDAVSFLNHPQMGWLILHGTEDYVIKYVTLMVAKMTRIRHRRFDTRQEGLEFLVSVDTTLPALEELSNL